MKKTNRNMQWVLALVFVLLGFLMAYQYKQLQDPVKKLTVQETEDLFHEIEMLKEEKAALIENNNELTEELKSYEIAASSSNEANQLLKTELDHSRLLLGLVDVKGPGLTLSLKPTDPLLNPQTFSYLTDLELVYIINELKFAGAEAISINEKRIAIQTGIKSSSNNSYILINDEKVSPREEIVIKAIGDKNKLNSAVAFQGAMSYNALEFYDIRFQPVDELFISRYEKPFSTSFIEEAK
ncbi:DUF881 domain-containing protein [Proteiniclasticum sp. SCR006]|uniref:DUF881 domain-containing protein n=1 Tax=Proteiniclasticum aestuarii TaxID=2817862 RepID=A0A939KIA9_9CLOT|nr:DUF881 domain-containing protein [Proteiniclasticum aestuarii]MBO1263761.1 DUF881 domain-containing protein [Proteiniclasticum aestuarii]